MKTSFNVLRRWTCAIVLLVACAGQLQAQNVTIRPNNGTLLPCKASGDGLGVSGSGKVGWQSGLFSVWRHEQLALTMTSSDGYGVRSDGRLTVTNNNQTCDTDSTHMVLVDKYQSGVYLAIDLPYGYRLASYTIIFTRHDGNSQICNDYNYTVEQSNTLTLSEMFGNTHDDDGNYTIDTANVVNSATVTGNDTVTLRRTSLTDDDMNNVLYFKLSSGDTNLDDESTTIAAIDIIFAEIKFTVNEFTCQLDDNLSADSTFSDGVSFRRIYFNTGLTCFNEVTYQSASNVYRYGYDYANVYDLTAPMLFYEEAAVDFDITDGKDRIMPYVEGTGCKSITGVATHNGKFGFLLDYDKYSKSASDNRYTDHRYFIEAPCWTTNSNGDEMPCHYRITGGKLTFGTMYYETYSATKHTITYTSTSSYGQGSSSSTTYYLALNSSGSVVWQEDEFTWDVSSETDADYISANVNGTTYYLTYTSSSSSSGSGGMGGGMGQTTYTLTTTTNKDDATDWNNNNGYLYITISSQGMGGQNTYYISYNNGNAQLSGGSSRSGGSTRAATYTVTEAQTSSDEYETLEACQVKIYDRDGRSVLTTLDVPKGDTISYTFPADYLNNDAIMFETTGTVVARFDVNMESLFPYIDRMRIICKDVKGTGEGLYVQSNYVADDFNVAGGDFYFNLPSVCKGDSCEVYFNNLYSVDADESYYSGQTIQRNGHSRYGFVRSPYFDKFYTDQYDATADYSYPIQCSNNNLYNNLAAVESWPYEDKVAVKMVGTEHYKFNNTDSVNANGGFFREYAYSVENYEAQCAKNGNTEPFKIIGFNYLTDAYQTDTAFLVTYDEPHYNIAPTSGSQHRYYSDYWCAIHVNAESGHPILTPQLVYREDETYYGTGQKQDFYGIQVDIDTSTGHAAYTDQGTLFKALSDSLKNNDRFPDKMDQILYLDLSSTIGLLEVVADSVSSAATMTASQLDSLRAVCIPLDSIRRLCSPNALIFMPYANTPYMDNAVVVADTLSGHFVTSMNLNITDKYPFYTPYDFSVNAANYALYTRAISAATGKQSQKVTLMLPFEMDLDGEGLHTDTVTNCKMRFYTMNADDCLSDTTAVGDNIGSADYNGYDFKDFAYFSPVEGNATEANWPYFVDVEDFGTVTTSNFAVAQVGAEVKKSTNHLLAPCLAGDESQGTINETTDDGLSSTSSAYTFTAMGTYSGQQVEKTKQVFYFAQNKFYNIQNLAAKYNYATIYPYRAYYEYTTTGSANAVRLMGVVFGVNPGTSGYNSTTGIGAAQASATSPDLAVIPGNGTLTLCAREAQQVNVYTIGGTKAASVSLRSGEATTIGVPSGVYVVNNVRILVK